VPIPAARVFYPQIESLRGVAALAVAGEHCFTGFINESRSATLPLDDATGIADFLATMLFDGGAAVPLFFLISGFVLTRGIPGGDVGVGWYAGYGIKRLFRIIPAMWLSIAVAASVWLMLGDQVTGRQILNHLLFRSSEFNNPLWSLRVEMIASLAFPVLVILCSRLSLAANLFVQFVLTAAMMRGMGPAWFGFFYLFHLGYLAAAAPERFPVLLSVLRTPLVIIAILVLCCAQNASKLIHPSYAYFLLGVGLPSFIVVAYLAHVDGPLSHWLSVAWLPRLLGRVSYSFYVLHFVVLAAFNATLIRVVGADTAFGNALLMQVVDFVLTLPLTLLLASLSYRFVEVPGIVVGRRIAAAVRAVS
jgi:peptidoglycan/LPS O-acetylase OafA/YrhL